MDQQSRPGLQFPERLPLAVTPTPIEPLLRLGELLNGPKLFVKRDDLTGLAGGGNKTRKLEYLLAEARVQGADHIVTIGSPQSNHCRQTAAAAARCGFGCSLVLKGHASDSRNGNLLLDHILGAHIYWTDGENPHAVIEKVQKQLISMGHRPYLIPYGGSNVVGAAAYVQAMLELKEQLDEQQLNIDVIVHASSSGGTQAGLVLGAHLTGFRGQIFGVSVDRPAEDLRAQVAALITATATHIGLETVGLIDKVDINDDYAEPGYAVLTHLEKEAIQLTAQREGLLLDPVYTGRAMGALIDLIRWGAFTRSQRILFWHTGGTPALYAYSDALRSASK